MSMAFTVEVHVLNIYIFQVQMQYVMVFLVLVLSKFRWWSCSCNICIWVFNFFRWAAIALTTVLIRGATIPLLINQLKATSKLSVSLIYLFFFNSEVLLCNL